MGIKKINEIKLTHLLDADLVREANDKELKEITGAEKGGVGPVKADWADKIIADNTVKGLYNFVVGANETGYQLKKMSTLTVILRLTILAIFELLTKANLIQLIINHLNSLLQLK